MIELRSGVIVIIIIVIIIRSFDAVLGTSDYCDDLTRVLVPLIMRPLDAGTRHLSLFSQDVDVETTAGGAEALQLG